MGGAHNVTCQTLEEATVYPLPQIFIDCIRDKKSWHINLLIILLTRRRHDLTAASEFLYPPGKNHIEGFL